MAPSPLYGVLYLSEPVGIERTELDAIMAGSRQRNAANDVTGVLVALHPTDDGDRCTRFVQWLEGPMPTVQALYGTISRDARHRDVQLLWNGPVERRLCPTWRMALRWHAHPAFADALDALGVELDATLTRGLSSRDVDRLILEAALQDA